MADTAQIDSEWFRTRFAEKRTSYRAFAREHGMDPSAVSRMLTGQRRMQRDEAAAIAQFIGAPISEVLKHAGVTIDGEYTPILLVATINEHGQIERLPEPRPLPHSVIDRARSAIDAVPRVLAAQIRALSGPLTVMDDAVVLFCPTDDVDSASIGALSICRNFAGDQILAKIERARKTGEARVVTIDGKVKEFDLQTATPVLTIIP
uniref:helix-turn-helix domain-containing protein n=1 Tax=Hyphomicrobium sp. ghe19 TaxID=2682968 RepID=UPI00403EFA43